MKKKANSIFALLLAVLLFTNSWTALFAEAATAASCSHPSYTVDSVRRILYASHDDVYHYDTIELTCVCSVCKTTFIKSYTSTEGESHSLVVKAYLGNGRHVGSMHFEDCIKRCVACGYECYDTVSWSCPGPPCPVLLHSIKPEEQIR